MSGFLLRMIVAKTVENDIKIGVFDWGTKRSHMMKMVNGFIGKMIIGIKREGRCSVLHTQYIPNRMIFRNG